MSLILKMNLKMLILNQMNEKAVVVRTAVKMNHVWLLGLVANLIVFHQMNTNVTLVKY